MDEKHDQTGSEGVGNGQTLCYDNFVEVDDGDKIVSIPLHFISSASTGNDFIYGV